MSVSCKKEGVIKVILCTNMIGVFILLFHRASSFTESYIPTNGLLYAIIY